jgi:hypothetical protein
VQRGHRTAGRASCRNQQCRGASMMRALLPTLAACVVLAGCSQAPQQINSSPPTVTYQVTGNDVSEANAKRRTIVRGTTRTPCSKVCRRQRGARSPCIAVIAPRLTRGRHRHLPRGAPSWGHRLLRGAPPSATAAAHAAGAIGEPSGSEQPRATTRPFALGVARLREPKGASVKRWKSIA